MKLTVTINLDNAAFGEGMAGDEVARILRKLAESVSSHYTFTDGDSVTLLDYNGNRVGTAEVKE